jgi:hypothetical protein
MEGDAVSMETALTKGGRGRLPSFTLWQRGLELSGIRYSYYKNYLGSYEALYPRNDHYRLGYLLCSYIQRHYGIDIWDRVLEDTGKYFIFFTFDSSLKRSTGKTITELYDDALNEYNSLWSKQINALPVTDCEIKSAHMPERYDNYLFPSINSSGDIFALNFSRDRKLTIGSIDNKGDYKAIRRIPYEVMYGMMMNERTLSSGEINFSGESLFLTPDGVIKVILTSNYMIQSQMKLWLSDKRRFIASVISENGDRAVAIEYTRDLKYRISIFDTIMKREIMAAK